MSSIRIRTVWGVSTDKDGQMNRNLTLQEERADQLAREMWESDPKLRAEFSNDLAACLAFFRAEVRGATLNHAGRVTK